MTTTDNATADLERHQGPASERRGASSGGQGVAGADASLSAGEWEPGADRFDPIALLEEQNETRVPDLVPVRHGRMMVSPFTFYRGAAKIMAADLEHTPTAGLTVSSAAMPTCRTSAHLPRRNDSSCST